MEISLLNFKNFRKTKNLIEKGSLIIKSKIFSGKRTNAIKKKQNLLLLQKKKRKFKTYIARLGSTRFLEIHFNGAQTLFGELYTINNIQN